jgi:uncharacterized protein
MNTETLIILLCLFIAMLIGSTIGFGDALILIPFLSWIVGIQAAIVLCGFWGILLNIINTIKYRQYRDWAFLKTNIGGGLPGIVLGSILIVYSPVQWIQLALGIAILTFSIIKLPHWWKRYFDKTQTAKLSKNTKSLSQAMLITGGFSYGFFGGLIGASGPINVILLEETGHTRENLIGNFAIAGLVLTIVKLGIYTATGLFPESLIVVYFIGIPIILLAGLIGHRITPKIPIRWFELGVLIILLIISIRLILTAF